MAPTVYMSEMPERPSPMDDRLSAHYIGERKRSTQLRKKTYRYCYKSRMGLVVEECRQPTGRPESPSPTFPACDGPQHGSLLHITLRTLALLRRNQQLQHKLSLLQAETHAFVESVLNGPTVSHQVVPESPATQ